MTAALLGKVKKKAMELLTLSEEKITPLRMESRLIKVFKDKKLVKKALREMIIQGEIFYSNFYGLSFVEKSRNKPLPVSNHVVLIPAEMHTGCNPGWVTVRMAYGGSFGDGHHPTTRISIRGVEAALNRRTLSPSDFKKAVLDIGTGSGVLAIVAVKLGMKKAIGVDMESIARKEARENVAINGLTGKIEIVATEIEAISGRFFLILANLRPPTLNQMIPHMERLLIPRGAVVISGFREKERLSIRDEYSKRGFHPVWEESEAGWSGFVLERCTYEP